MDCDIVHKYIVISHHRVVVNITERTDGIVVAEFRFGVDESQWTDLIHNYLFLTICAVNVASDTTVSPTNM